MTAVWRTWRARWVGDAWNAEPVPVSGRDLLRAWAVAAIILGVYFFAWWMHLRPGVFSFDSGFYLQQAGSGELTNLKPFFYARFLQLVTGGGAWPELACIVQAGIVVLAFARMLAIAYVTRVPIVAWVLAGLVMLNPYVANMAFYVQNDVLFSVAMLMIAVETLRGLRARRFGMDSVIVFAVFAPMALLFRQNGVLYLPFWLAGMAMLLPMRLWARVLGPAVIAAALAMATIIGVARDAPGQEQDLLYPAVVHEVAHLARPGYRTALGARLSMETRQVLPAGKLALASAYYWPLYWDTIAFFPDGPMMVDLAPAQRQALVSSFLRNDLLPNAPMILAHRLEIFLGASLARAELADPYHAPVNLPPALLAAKQARSAEDGGVIGRLNRAAIATRGITWNALVGVLVLAVLVVAALWRRDGPLLLCAALLCIQGAVIFLVAPSAEYRYVFPVYLAPLLLLVGRRRNVESRAVTARAPWRRAATLHAGDRAADSFPAGDAR